jgi:YegS/Rv2252/BmrU family lipid kinase
MSRIGSDASMQKARRGFTTARDPDVPADVTGLRDDATVRSARSRVPILFNPVSGRETAERRRLQLQEAAEALGLQFELLETSKERGAEALARMALQQGATRVLACGGDGTIAAAAAALAGTDAALGVLPAGTGNLVAINLGIPLDLRKALRLAVTGEPLPTDVGRVNGRVFLVGAGMGADARLIREASRELKSRLGPLAYFVAGCRNLRRPPARFTITIDGRRFRRRAQAVMVFNMGRITGGVEFVPDTSPDDGLLQVAVGRVEGLRDLCRIIADIVTRKPRHARFLEIIRGRQITIEADRPLLTQFDGDVGEVTNRLDVQVEPGSLQVVRAAPCPRSKAPE